MIRLLMIAKTKDHDFCKWELDYPKFETVVHRAFAVDMAARGKYEHGT